MGKVKRRGPLKPPGGGGAGAIYLICTYGFLGPGLMRLVNWNGPMSKRLIATAKLQLYSGTRLRPTHMTRLN
jgi:hypothetical protein